MTEVVRAAEQKEKVTNLRVGKQIRDVTANDENPQSSNHDQLSKVDELEETKTERSSKSRHSIISRNSK